ncbi:MAG: hypothetical protein AMJ88_13430 [Anaerolineae bacterium SM23_ 63]|nr:MAG: hypothetical protein AMJ88_13430 [Anaerolineae bacterium SM23_ 63]
MPVFSHKNAHVEVDVADISGESNDCKLTIDIGVSETTCFEDDWDQFEEDIAAWSLAIKGFAAQDADEVDAVLFAFVGAGAQDLVYYPMGTLSGYKYSGKAIMTSYAVGGPVKGACPFAANFQGTGELSRTAFGD